ncbi:MAG: Snf7 family protein [Nitrosotalea sp.]
MKLHEKEEIIFKKIVDATMLQNCTYAQAYAAELSQVRKIRKMVDGSRLAIVQIQLRLNTVSDLGDVVVTLSPAMSIIKGLSGGLEDLMPAAKSSAENLSSLIGEIMQSASFNGDVAMPSEAKSEESSAILDEVHTVLEQRARQKIPDLPSSLAVTRIKEEDTTKV